MRLTSPTQMIFGHGFFLLMLADANTSVASLIMENVASNISIHC